MLIQKSSALTFQVIGNTKGVINAVTGIIVFGNEVTALAVVGYSITLSGVALYTREKRRVSK
jgi:drug/metabolite transporter (DMT)-like permease